MKGLLHRFESDPPPWAAWLIVQQILRKVRNGLLARALSAPGISVGARSTFRGVKHIRFGRSFRANGAVWIEAVRRYEGRVFTPAITIGDDVAASNDLHISAIGRISIGNQVLFGSRVYVSDHNHGEYRSGEHSPPDVPPARRPLGGGGPVTIEDKVWIGHNVTIVGPAFIGASAIIGANSVVRGHVPARTIVAGVPAVVVKRYDDIDGIWKK